MKKYIEAVLDVNVEVGVEVNGEEIKLSRENAGRNIDVILKKTATK
jgi:hypothetical protein